MIETAARHLIAGSVSLDPETRVLSGPRGSLLLAARHFALLERLMRRCGVIIAHGDLISALWPDPDDEPDNAEGSLRVYFTQLRSLLAAIGVHHDEIAVRCEPSVGYYLRVR